VKADFSWII